MPNKVYSVSIDDILFAERGELKRALIKDYNLIKTLCDIVDTKFRYTRLRFMHPIKVGNKVQVIGYKEPSRDDSGIYEFIPYHLNTLKRITSEDEWYSEQWETVQGHIVRLGDMGGDKYNSNFHIYKDGKWKSIIGNYGLNLTFSPDGKKAYPALPIIKEYDVNETEETIELIENKTQNKIRDEFSDVTRLISNIKKILLVSLRSCMIRRMKPVTKS